jgi:signal transduction histidine kinase
MPVRVLKQFTRLDPVVFRTLVEEMGYRSITVYKFVDDHYEAILSDGRSEHFPAIITPNSINIDTREPGHEPGWLGHVLSKNLKLPKSINVYLPDQPLNPGRFLFLVDGVGRKRDSQIDAYLEIIAHRIDQWSSDMQTRQFIEEMAVKEQEHRIGQHTKNLIDHELRMPLTTIVGYSHMLIGIETDSEKTKMLHTLQQHADIALRAIERLGLILIDNPILEKAEPFPIIKALEATIADIRRWEKTDSQFESSAEIHFVVPEPLKNTYVIGKDDALRQAFSEVVQNALVFSNHGEITISAYQADQKIIIDIQDDGIGIPPGAEDLIFMQFFRGHSNLKVRRGHRGLGLGLYLARQITERHAGQLIAVRRLDKGSLFRFILPIADSEPVAQSA